MKTKLINFLYRWFLIWFDIWWYKYLFAKRNGYTDVSWFTTLWCRMRNHPAGVWWYNANGYEPDMHCKNCGDEI